MFIFSYTLMKNNFFYNNPKPLTISTIDISFFAPQIMFFKEDCKYRRTQVRSQKIIHTLRWTLPPKSTFTWTITTDFKIILSSISENTIVLNEVGAFYNNGKVLTSIGIQCRNEDFHVNLKFFYFSYTTKLLQRGIKKALHQYSKSTLKIDWTYWRKLNVHQYLCYWHILSVTYPSLLYCSKNPNFLPLRMHKYDPLLINITTPKE
jgi:hypothetical protein